MVIPLKMNQGGRDVIEVHVLKCFHSVPTCGYLLAERRKRVRPDLVLEDKKATEENVKAAKRRGEEVCRGSTSARATGVYQSVVGV